MRGPLDAASSGWTATARARSTRRGMARGASQDRARVHYPLGSCTRSTPSRGRILPRGFGGMVALEVAGGVEGRAALLRRARAGRGWPRASAAMHTLVVPRRLDDPSSDGLRRARRGGHRRRPDPAERRPGGRGRSDRGLRSRAGEGVTAAAVAVLFGGRSAEHEICVRVRALRDRRARSADRYEVVAIGMTTRRVGGAPAARSAGAAGGCRPERSPSVVAGFGHRGRARRRSRARSALVAAGRFATRRSTWCSRSCTARTGEDGADPGHAGAGRRAVRGRGRARIGGRDGQGGAEGAVRRGRIPAVVPYEVVREPGLGGGSRGRRGPRVAQSRVPGVHQARDARVLDRHRDRSTTLDELRGRPRRRPSGSRRKAVLETSGRRDPRDRASRCSGNDDPVASVAGEIVPTGHEFYDYEAKYLDDHGAAAVDPGRHLQPDTLEQIQRLAVAAFRAIDGAGMARVDFFPCEDGTGVWVNESQHDPGVHRHLDVPAAVGGLGPGLPRTGRPADRARDRAPRGRTQATGTWRI